MTFWRSPKTSVAFLGALIWLNFGAFAAAESCAQAIGEAAVRHGVPVELLHAIASVESGHDPLILNIGGRVYRPATAAEATALLYRADGTPRRDATVGCMQIHTGAHLAAIGGRPEPLLSASFNVDYGTRLLRTLYDRSGSWRTAVRRYQGGTGSVYICHVDRRLAAHGATFRLGCP